LHGFKLAADIIERNFMGAANVSPHGVPVLVPPRKTRAKGPVVAIIAAGDPCILGAAAIARAPEKIVIIDSDGRNADNLDIRTLAAYRTINQTCCGRQGSNYPIQAMRWLSARFRNGESCPASGLRPIRRPPRLPRRHGDGFPKSLE
jgi:hypothetical protein